MTARYSYWNKADSTFTLGYAALGEGWSADGTIGITKDTGVGASDNHNGYYSHYYEGKYDYAMYRQINKPGDQCAGYGSRKQNPTEWDGAILPGNKVAGRKGATCHGSVNYVTVDPGKGSNWKEEGKSIWWQVGVATPWSFSFGDRTGYSTHTKEMWTNHNSFRSFLCGPKSDTSHFRDWRVVYSYNHR